MQIVKLVMNHRHNLPIIRSCKTLANVETFGPLYCRHSRTIPLNERLSAVLFIKMWLSAERVYLISSPLLVSFVRPLLELRQNSRQKVVNLVDAEECYFRDGLV